MPLAIRPTRRVLRWARMDRPGDHEYDGTVSDRFGSHRPPAVASITPRSAQSSIIFGDFLALAD